MSTDILQSCHTVRFLTGSFGLPRDATDPPSNCSTIYEAGLCCTSILFNSSPIWMGLFNQLPTDLFEYLLNLDFPHQSPSVADDLQPAMHVDVYTSISLYHEVFDPIS